MSNVKIVSCGKRVVSGLNVKITNSLQKGSLCILFMPLGKAMVSFNEDIYKMKSGDEDSRQKLILHNLRLVSHIVRKYYSASKNQDYSSISITDFENTLKQHTDIIFYYEKIYLVYLSRSFKNALVRRNCREDNCSQS